MLIIIVYDNTGTVSIRWPSGRPDLRHEEQALARQVVVLEFVDRVALVLRLKRLEGAVE
jgi:hypothetical protein